LLQELATITATRHGGFSLGRNRESLGEPGCANTRSDYRLQLYPVLSAQAIRKRLERAVVAASLWQPLPSLLDAACHLLWQVQLAARAPGALTNWPWSPADHPLSQANANDGLPSFSPRKWGIPPQQMKSLNWPCINALALPNMDAEPAVHGFLVPPQENSRIRKRLTNWIFSPRHGTISPIRGFQALLTVLGTDRSIREGARMKLSNRIRLVAIASLLVFVKTPIYAQDEPALQLPLRKPPTHAFAFSCAGMPWSVPGAAPFAALTAPATAGDALFGIARAEQLIQLKAWTDAIRILQIVLDSKTDAFVLVSGTKLDGKAVTRYASAKAEANRLLGTLPAKGRDEYQKLYGAAATERLKQAKLLNDAKILADVTTRYLHTTAGIEATNLLATRCLDRDEPLLASLYFDRLLAHTPPQELTGLTLYKAALASYRAGFKEKGDAAWKQLAEKVKKEGGLTIEKKFVPLKQLREELDKEMPEEPSAAEPAPALVQALVKQLDDSRLPVRQEAESKLRRIGSRVVPQLREELNKRPPLEVRRRLENIIDELLRKGLVDWPMFRGSPARSEQPTGSAPFLEASWSVSTLPTKSDVKHWTEDNLNHAIRSLQDQRGQPILPSFFPITVRDKVIYRTYDGVYCVNLKREGKLEWYSYTDGGVHNLLSDPNKKGYLEGWNQVYRQNGPQGVLYENSMVGALTSDGTRVFVIDDLAISPHPYQLRNQGWGPQPNFGSLTDMVSRNSLKAYNLEIGKLIWELGGKFDKESVLAGSFFLGPPLPLGGKLYVLTEKNAELRLACIEPKDTVEMPQRPEIVWTQSLAHTKERMPSDLNRRIHSAHLSYANGILVCPTNAGAVMGVDLLTRNLLWAYTYSEAPKEAFPGINQFGGRAFLNGMPVNAMLHPEWRVSAPAIADGKVVFTALDAPSLHCLNLRDGSLLWKTKRETDDLYFAGIFHGKALIVGKSYVKAFDLATGKEAWPKISNIGTPSGQGTAADNVYYLPLKIGPDKEPEVCAIDVGNGKVIAHVKSRKKEVPGNLIFHRGEVLSQTLTTISCYPQLQAKLNFIDERIKANAKDPEALVERSELRQDKGDLTGAVADLQTALKNNPPADLVPKARAKLFEALTELFHRDFAAAEMYLDDYKAMCKSDNAAEQQRREFNFLMMLAKGREKQGKLVEALVAYLAFAAVTGNADLVPDIDEPNTKVAPLGWARGRIALLMEKATPEQRKQLEAKIAEEWKKLQGKN
jgi:tetratricopeptide (TPR) repeat protein